MTEPQLGMSYDTQRTLAAFAERRRLAAFARSDHYSFQGVTAPHATDAFASLAGLAAETSSVGLVVLVSPITFRHPAVMAKNATTIDEISNGRFSLGVGTGWMELEHSEYGIEFFDTGTRFDRFEEALAYLHHAFGRRKGPFEGRHYSLLAEEVRPLPTGPLPIVVGGSGERRTPRLAGTFADEYNLTIRPRDEMVKRIERAREAAVAAGREPSDIRVSVMMAVVAGHDGAAYERNLKRIAAADPFRRDAGTIAERYRERGLPIGDSDSVGEAVARLAEIGVDRIYLQHFGPHDEDLLDEAFDALGA